MPAPDGGDDFNWVCCPNKWLWHLVRLLDESLDGSLKLDNGAKDAALEALLGQFGKIALYLIQPGTGRRREVKAEALVACQPGQNSGMLVSGVVVVCLSGCLSRPLPAVQRIESASALTTTYGRLLNNRISISCRE
jgi:hypothetical protein